MQTKNDSTSAFYVPYLPIVKDTTAVDAIPYGVESLTMPIGNNETVSIDRAFLAGKSTLRLRNIKQCLTACGKDVKSKEDRKWFNKSVRDVWHKALKHANKLAMTNGTAVSIGMTKRTSKSKSTAGDVTYTSRFSYETTVKAQRDETQVEDKRKANKPRKSKGIVSVNAALSAARKTATVKTEATAERQTAPATPETVA